MLRPGDIFRRFLEAAVLLIPLVLAVYLWRFQQPPLLARDHLMHELAIALACGLGAFVTRIAYHSYRQTGEFFARHLMLGLGSFTVLYAFHGLLTRMDGHNMWLFVLFGPAARLILAGFIAAGAFGVHRPAEPPRAPWLLWRAPLLLTAVAGAVALGLALSPIAALPAVRWGMEGVTILLCAAAIARLLLRQAPFGMKPYVIAGLTLTAQSSLTFLMTGAWTHLWWLAHLTGAAGFLALSYGVLRSEAAGWSLTRLFSEREMRRELDHAQRVGEALRRAKEEAEAASRSKSQFLAAMSHELRTPLNAIIGFSDMMRGQTHGPLGSPRYAEYTTLIGDSGRHLLEVINDVLDVSRVETGALALEEDTVDLERVATSAMTMVRDRAERTGVVVDMRLPHPPPRLRGDARRIKQVLLNLLGNAVKFSQAGGTVTLSAARLGDGSLAVTVADTGIGMAAEDIPKALELFGQVDSRLERRFEGTGLGLPLSAGFMALHGGRLDIDSGLGQGTRVTITFPAERVLAEEPAAPQRA